jgi:hypothetical protein
MYYFPIDNTPTLLIQQGTSYIRGITYKVIFETYYRTHITFKRIDLTQHR